MSLELRPYQIVARDYMLSHDRCALWASPGMGKTSTALAAIRDIALLEDGPALVLAPKRVARDVWPTEAVKWGLGPVQPVLGTEAQRIKALHDGGAIFSCNYEQLPWLVERCNPWPFPIIIADEATRLKSYRIRQGGSRAHALGTVQKHVKHFIELTGTPSPNGLIDLWGQMWFIDAGARLGRTFTAFKQRFFSENKYTHGITPLAGAQEKIQELLSDVCLTLDPHDYFSFQEPIVTNIYCDLPTKAYSQYRTMERELFLRIGSDTAEAFNAAALSNKCLQLASGAVYLDDGALMADRRWAAVHDEKLQAVESLATELNGAPLIVAYWFHSDLARLQKAFPSARVLTSKKDEDDWNAGKIPMLLVHPASAGHGIQLQWGGNHLAWFTQIWSLELRMQMIERIGPVRQLQAGLDRPVHEYHILARHTIDEQCAERAISKRSVQDALLLAGKRRNT